MSDHYTDRAGRPLDITPMKVTNPWTDDQRAREVNYAYSLLDGPDGYMIEPIRRHEHARAWLAWEATVLAAEATLEACERRTAVLERRIEKLLDEIRAHENERAKRSS